MGLFGIKSKNELIDDLGKEIEENYNSYLDDAKDVNKKIDFNIRDYNDQIPIINTIRNNEFGPQIDILYKFLKEFGDIGTEISPFDFVTEKTRVNHHNDMGKSQDRDKNGAYTEFGDSIAAGVAATGLSGTATTIAFGAVASPAIVLLPFVAPLAIGGVLKAFSNDKEKKSQILELTKQKENNELAYKKDLDSRKFYIKTMKEGLSIAEIYRVNLKSISRSINETVIPELGLVKSFLLAEDVKNKIISNEELDFPKAESILLYKDTPYHKHYVFVQNAFLFYKTIVEFYSKPILTTLLEDHKITKVERKTFDKSIESINKQLGELKNNSILNEEDINESERSS